MINEYYKIYFRLLTHLLDKRYCYNVYLDIKDTLGGRKIANLREILSNAMWDFDQSAIRQLEQVRSHQVGMLQLADVLIGAVNCANRTDVASAAKREVASRVVSRSGFDLTKSTYLSEVKFNVFHWTGGLNASLFF